MGLAGGDDADARHRGIQHHMVQPVAAAIGLGGLQLMAVQPRLLLPCRIAGADVEAALRQALAVRDLNVEVGGGNVCADRGAHRVVDALQAHPAAAVAGHRPAVDAEVDDLLNAGRIEDRHHGIDQGELALVAGGGGLTGVVVPQQSQHPALSSAAGQIGVAEGVAAAVHPWPFAVPDAEHAVAFAVVPQPDLLRSPNGGGRQVLVDAGLKDDVVLRQDAPGPLQLPVKAAKRGASVAGDVAGGAQPLGTVQLPLQQRQTHQGLGAGDVNPALLGILVFKRDGGCCGFGWHGWLPQPLHFDPEDIALRAMSNVRTSSTSSCTWFWKLIIMR